MVPKGPRGGPRRPSDPPSIGDIAGRARLVRLDVMLLTLPVAASGRHAVMSDRHEGPGDCNDEKFDGFALV